MPDEYQSIKEDDLRLLAEHLPDIQERFFVQTIGLFGSVSRGEDTPESDVDILSPGFPGWHVWELSWDSSGIWKNCSGEKLTSSVLTG